ncbi:hypothetical protein ACSSS7_000145 [Eimeria intestinalis]
MNAVKRDFFVFTPHRVLVALCLGKEQPSVLSVGLPRGRPKPSVWVTEACFANQQQQKQQHQQHQEYQHQQHQPQQQQQEDPQEPVCPL